MIGYADVFTPAESLFVTPVIPNAEAYALVPGPPCPCVNTIAIPSFLSRSVVRRHEKCGGFASRTTTTIYTKGEENPFDETEDPESYLAWENAWQRIIHIVKEGTDGDRRHTVTTYNLGAADQLIETSACPVLGVTEEIWDPGEFDENPGRATYTSTTEVESTPMPDVGTPDLDIAFRGEPGGALPSGYTIARNADDTESSVLATEWYWRLDLSAWPTSREWPAGYVFRGWIVWEKRISDYQADDFDPANRENYLSRNGTLEYEFFEVTEENRIWEGEKHTDIPNGGIGVNEVRILENLPIPGYELLLPIE